MIRTRLASRSAGGDVVLVDGFRTSPWGEHQEQDAPSWLRHQSSLERRKAVVGGEWYAAGRVLLFINMCELQAWIPRRLPEDIGLGDRWFRRSERRTRTGDYEIIPNSPMP